MITSKNERQSAKALREERGLRKKAKRHGMTTEISKHLRAAQSVIEFLEIEEVEEAPRTRNTYNERKDW